MRNLGSAKGTYLNGVNTEKVQLLGSSQVQFGGQGPTISVFIQEKVVPEEKPAA